MCERVWRNTQDCEVKQGLAAGSHEWLAACKPPEDAHEWSMQRSWTVMPAVALQDKKSRLAIQLARGLDSWLSQVVRPSRLSTLLWKKLTLHIPFSLQYKYPLYPQNIESFQREFWERNPREKQDWRIHNLYVVTFIFLYSHPLHCYILERFISQNFSHLTHICEKAFWYFGKQFRRNQFILVDAMGYSGI